MLGFIVAFLLMLWVLRRSENSSSDERCNRRARARDRIPKLQRFNDWSRRNVCNTSVTGWHSSVARRRLRRMLRYVYIYSARLQKGIANARASQNEYASILAKRVNEEKAKKSELRSKWRHIFLVMARQSLTNEQSAVRRQ